MLKNKWNSIARAARQGLITNFLFEELISIVFGYCHIVFRYRRKLLNIFVWIILKFTFFDTVVRGKIESVFVKLSLRVPSHTYNVHLVIFSKLLFGVIIV
jgi:hypothetical protein